MKLYHHPLSGHSHRAHLFLSLLGVPYELIEVDMAAGAHKAAEFLTLNPFGQVPVLDDDGTVIADSSAILVYLSRKYGRTDWLPEEAVAAARIQKWLSVAAGEIAYGPCAARLVTVFGADFRMEEVIARAHRILALVEAELSGRSFLLGAKPTIADIALYSYIANAPEGNVDTSAYPSVRAWLARIEALPGFVGFRKTKIGLAA
ncbi:glutathione S-transferase family protein [Rhizobium lentis]|uniref:Glutathione S-transferase n=1 Tax=Rhizobium lentis TaxID=1138194 RepID=A0ABS7IES4_9HYPH|nr:glutathione S-transferase [Rhizobium lentis]MBX5042807.1 glutathione S-transferase [Rhizobium lentis]MBX5051332.1 glutathione S-transferase [Rhizobium lentis]MBX5067554.1 glutathione S-transferase [Rhizobium lentis]MBX5072641.1 glutathione S-transferase [Rhizobium lentis]MBX5077997.1 glutathione S-transferase [Rhizobium lentis]